MAVAMMPQKKSLVFFKRLPANVFMFTNAKSSCYGDRVIIANMMLTHVVFLSNLLGRIVHGLPLSAADTLAGTAVTKLKKTVALCKKMTGMPFDVMVAECGKRMYGLMIAHARKLAGSGATRPLDYVHRQLIHAALSAAAPQPLLRRQLMDDVDVVFACSIIPTAKPPHHQLFGEPLPSCGLRGYEFLFFMRQMCVYRNMDMVRFIRAMGKAEVALMQRSRDSSKDRRGPMWTPALLEINNGKLTEFLVFLFCMQPSSKQRTVICHFGHKELPNKGKYMNFAANVLGASKKSSIIKDVEFAEYIVSPPASSAKEPGGMHRVDMQLGCYVFRRVYYGIDDHQKVLTIMRDKKLLCPHTKTSELRKMMNLKSLLR